MSKGSDSIGTGVAGGPVGEYVIKSPSMSKANVSVSSKSPPLVSRT